MKQVSLGVTLLALTSSASLAQVPVTDGAAIAQQAASHVETIANMVNQIDQAKQQFGSMTGSRNLGTIMNNPALRDYLPADWQGVYDSVRNGGYGGLSGRGASVYNASKIFDSCVYMTVADQRTACEARAVKASQDKGFALDAYDAAKSRIYQIDQLMNEINETADPKAIAELQGRLAAEQANIQNEQTKLQLYEMVAAAEEKVQAQRQREIQARTWSAKKGITVQPLTFGD